MTSVIQVPPIRLRDYQERAIESILEHRAVGVRRQLLSLPTGLGKTVLFVSLPERLALGRFDVTLIVAHTDELIDQAVEAIQEIIPGVWVDVEKAERRASPMARVVVGSVQSLRGKRLSDFLARFRSRICALVVDEAHRSTAPTYRALIDRVLEENQQSLLLGVTATPRRFDNVGLDSVYEKMIFHMSIREAIEQGYLCPIEAYRVDGDAVLDGIATRAGDWASDQLASAINTDARNAIITESYLKLGAGKQAIVFAGSVEHARSLSTRFERSGIRSAAVYGEMPKLERPLIIDAFRRREIAVLTNYSVILEGFNVPGVELIVAGRPTQSSVVYTQAIGRGLRPHESIARKLGAETTAQERLALIAASPKPAAIVIDVVDMTRRHSLQTIPSLFGLPPKLNAKGRRILQVVETYEKVAAKSVQAAKSATDISDLEFALERVDVFTVPDFPPELEGASNLSWFQSSDGVYRLSMPPYRTATSRTGKRITGFDRALRAKLRDEPQITEDMALSSLGIDPLTVETINVSVEIHFNSEAGTYTTWCSWNDHRRQVGTATTLLEACDRTDRWIRARFPDAFPSLRRGAAWQSLPPKEAQLWRLRRLGVPKDHIPKTRGECSRLIDKLDGSKRGRVPGRKLATSA